MTETGQAITAAVWLAYTLLLALRWTREGMRKDNGTDALQGQQGGKNSGQKNGAVPPRDMTERGLCYCVSFRGKCKRQNRGLTT